MEESYSLDDGRPILMCTLTSMHLALQLACNISCKIVKSLLGNLMGTSKNCLSRPCKPQAGQSLQSFSRCATHVIRDFSRCPYAASDAVIFHLGLGRSSQDDHDDGPGSGAGGADSCGDQ